MRTDTAGEQIVGGFSRNKNLPMALACNTFPEPKFSPDVDRSIAQPLPLLLRGKPGRLWHKTGANITSDRPRAGIFSWYTQTYVRTQENWFLSLKPEIRQFASNDMLTLLGYKTYGFGMVNGVSPE